jgi:hypothetical protein
MEANKIERAEKAFNELSEWHQKEENRNAILTPIKTKVGEPKGYIIDIDSLTSEQSKEVREIAFKHFKNE